MRDIAALVAIVGAIVAYPCWCQLMMIGADEGFGEYGSEPHPVLWTAAIVSGVMLIAGIVLYLAL